MAKKTMLDAASDRARSEYVQPWDHAYCFRMQPVMYEVRAGVWKEKIVDGQRVWTIKRGGDCALYNAQGYGPRDKNTGKIEQKYNPDFVYRDAREFVKELISLDVQLDGVRVRTHENDHYSGRKGAKPYTAKALQALLASCESVSLVREQIYPTLQFNQKKEPVKKKPATKKVPAKKTMLG